MKRVWHGFLNFLKLLFQTLISPFIKNKKEEIVEEKVFKSEKLEQIKKKQLNATGAVTGTPDDHNIMSNPHNETTETGETESTRIYSLPRELSRMIEVNSKYSYLAFNDEEIDELIDNCFEEKIYKKDGFKMYRAKRDPILRKKFEDFKKEIVPKIKDRIYFQNIVDVKDLKKEIEYIIKEQLEITPIFEKPKEEVIEEPKVEPYFMATPRKKALNLPDETIKVKEEDVIINLEEKETIEKRLETPSTMMVQNTDIIEEPSFIEEIPKLVAVPLAVATNGVIQIIKEDELPKLKEDELQPEEVEEEKDIDAQIEEITA